MAQIKLNTLQIVLMANYENLLIQIILMAHICWKGTIQIKDMFQIVATWLQFSTKEYIALGTVHIFEEPPPPYAACVNGPLE